AQRRITAAADQLKSLSDEFDFPNAAAAQLDVVLHAEPGDFASNHPLELTQRLQRAEVEIAAVDEGPQHLQQLRASLPVAGDHPRLDHGVALPLPTLALVVGFQRVEAHRQRAAAAEGAQPYVDAENEAIRRRLVQHGDQLPSQGGEKLLVAPATRAVGAAGIGKGEDQVDVRGEIQLAAAQLSHAQHHQLLWLSLTVAGHAPLR